MASTATARTHDREATCNAILDATGEIISEKGLDGFTISEISRRANVNRALIYHYYQNRENLVTHAIDRIMDRYETPESSLSGEAVVRNARAYIEHPEIGRLIFQLMLSGRPLLRLGERLATTLGHVEQIRKQQFPDSDEDTTFGMIVLALCQFGWSVSRNELAAAMGMDVEEADDRFVEELRRVSELGMKEFLAGPSPAAG